VYRNGAFDRFYGSGIATAELRRGRAAEGREINDLMRVRLLPLQASMTIFHPMESTITRKIMWTGVVLLAATAAACSAMAVTLAHKLSVRRCFHLCRTRTPRQARHLFMRSPGEL